MNEFLQSRRQIDDATKRLQANGFATHPISCKDWELLKITEQLENGDLLDMGADGSRVLHNAVIKGITGGKVGIDLKEVTGDNRAPGVDYFVDNMMNTSFGDEEFDMIVSQSTIEHEVDLVSFVKEVNRLLKPSGKLIVSFDYWTDRIDTSGVTLYGLKWNILSLSDVLHLVELLKNNRIWLTSAIDWNAPEKVINDKYCSPAAGIGYTFGILEFKKI